MAERVLRKPGRPARMEQPLAFPARLREAMAARALGPSALAQHIGVTRRVVQKWVRGQCYPCLQHLIHICDALGVSADWILGRGCADDCTPSRNP